MLCIYIGRHYGYIILRGGGRCVSRLIDILIFSRSRMTRTHKHIHILCPITLKTRVQRLDEVQLIFGGGSLQRRSCEY